MTRDGSGQARPLLLKGARIVDGRGVRHERADVLVSGEQIAAIEPNLGRAKTE